MSLKSYIDNYFVDTSKHIDISNFFKFSDNCDHRTEAVKLEQQIFEMVGFQMNKDIWIYDVPINFQGKNYIHTVECGRKNKETLILMHGYSGSLILFYNMLKELSRKFHVYCVDYLGQGLSSRPEFTCTTPEETMHYFVESFEKWRKALRLKKYYLGGHSFGGYIAAICAYKNKKGVKGLYLMSATGVSESEDNVASEEWAQALGWAKKHFWLTYFQVYTRLYEGKTTPAELVRKHPYLGRIFIKKYMVGLTNNEQHGELLGEFLYHVLMMPGGSEQSVHYILRPPRICAHIALEKTVLEKIRDIPIYCFYGVEDWNDWTGSYRLAQDPKNKNFTFIWISESGHQMTLQNPREVTEKILTTLGSDSPKTNKFRVFPRIPIKVC